jgi:hypothetical protein
MPEKVGDALSAEPATKPVFRHPWGTGSTPTRTLDRKPHQEEDRKWL